ncbi:SURF1 family cytochrome oxidase biogenesis protein [Pengzhenrongella sicca]|uniref:SURF1-like protein n=1 Tax=Pengzhenrongella sicca TaxID=2819238 RepID=A0A8A4ZJQ1_9MICO|nr:SURF1 family protein [Pengzhenrongella sicca]QTE30736.1 SURF1 family protein [Pengzhenrongella sicca]
MTAPAGAAVRRTLGLVALAIALAVVCGLLGRWQWQRHVARDAVIAGIEASYDATPVPLDELLAGPDAALAGGDVWRPVTVVGHYDTAHTALLRNRPVTDRAGFHALVPFVPDGAPSGTVLVVDRGWVPTGEADRPDSVPAPPTGTVEITVRLRADEPASSRDAPAGQVQAISVDQVLAAGGLDPDRVDAYAAYGALAAEDPSAADSIGALPKPSTDPGSHLSYAFQWWVFALGSLIGFSRLAWVEWHEPDGAPGARRPADARRRHGPSAEDEEDALIDAQLR